MFLALLANLAGTAILFVRFILGREPFAALLRWQAAYLYVFAAWATIVAFLFPVFYGFR